MAYNGKMVNEEQMYILKH